MNGDVVVQCEGLTKRYGQVLAVDGLNLEIRAGEVFGLLGPNGAGKTTTITMMCGLLAPDAGRVLVNGQPISRAKDEIRTRIGVCPQQVVVWERLTALEQVEFVGRMYGLSRRTARRRGESLLEQLGLSGKRKARASTLSGGMKRRLNLILAIVHEPEIVILDEPEAGLDPQSRVLVREFIRSLARTHTVVLTTHNMDEAERLSDRVAIIDRGRLLLVDTPAALKHHVGEGDIVEIHLASGIQVAPSAVEDALSALPSVAGHVTVGDRRLVVRALDAVNALSEILDALRKAGMKAGEVRIRQNTLEDVFISLTGRELRE